MRGAVDRVRKMEEEGWGRSTGGCLVSRIWTGSSAVTVELQMELSNFPLFPCQTLSLFQSEDVIKSENDEADDMPEVQDTVQFIPGSKLLWRINCRPPNSSQVTVSTRLRVAVAGDLPTGTRVMLGEAPLKRLSHQHQQAAAVLAAAVKSVTFSITVRSRLVGRMLCLQLLLCAWGVLG